MAPHSSTLAWKIPWTEEPRRLQSMGLLRVGHDWATSLSRIGGGNGNPLQCSCLENPRDGRTWWAAIYRVAQSRTRLKWLSSSSSSSSYLTCLLELREDHRGWRLFPTKKNQGTQKGFYAQEFHSVLLHFILHSKLIILSILRLNKTKPAMVCNRTLKKKNNNITWRI